MDACQKKLNELKQKWSFLAHRKSMLLEAERQELMNDLWDYWKLYCETDEYKQSIENFINGKIEPLVDFKDVALGDTAVYSFKNSSELKKLI